MRTYALSILNSVAVAVFLTAPAWAVQGGLALMVGGQSQVCADTNLNGCPDDSDGCCSASVFPGKPPVIWDLMVTCNQTPNDPASIRGLYPDAVYDFDVLAFDPMSQSGELRQISGTGVSQNNLITDGKGFVIPGPGGPVHAVEIMQLNHFSSGMLCNQAGPAVLVQTGDSAPRMLFGLQQVNCSGCANKPSSPCVPDTQNPTDLKVTVPLRTISGGVVWRDVYTHLEGGSVTLSAVNTETIPIGAIAINGLGPCSPTSAPTATEVGLALLTLILLATGSWALGRRRAFSESIPLP
jgi:hypothetical protein